jgi:putative transposase
LGGNRGRLIDASTRKEALILINEACEAGARKTKACDLLNITIRTYERWKLEDGLKDKRQYIKTIPSNKLTLKERQAIIHTANSPAYCDFAPCKIVPMLADKGLYLGSESTFYRILREEKQLNHRGKSKPRIYHKPKALVAIKANQVWSWDITYLKTYVAGMHYYLYLIIDIYSRKIVGWTLQHYENSDYAAGLFMQACDDEKVLSHQVILHSDNGSPMKGATLLATLQKLGVDTSFSRPAVSNDNPFSEAIFKTLKYSVEYPRDGFASIEAGRIWVETFVYWYNNEHLHSGLKFVTPMQRHLGLDTAILANRKIVYIAAKQNNPQRWSREIRDWNLSNEVILNPDKPLKLA